MQTCAPRPFCNPRSRCSRRQASGPGWPPRGALQVMRIVDAGGPEPEARLTKDFDAADISDAPFGWNLPNWLLRREMVARLGELPNVSFRPGLGFARMLTRQTEALVTLSDGTGLGRLVIGADGRASPSARRLASGPEPCAMARRRSPSPLATDPASNISTEVHRSGGPFTLVPLPDRDSRPASAVVWMDRGPEIARLAALPVPEFEAEMTPRSTGILGPLTLPVAATVWPIISQIADRLSGPRAVLLAEAAHVVPPIGAQGLNMSLADLAALLALADRHRDDPGQPAVTDAYHRQRHLEVQARVTGIDLLNRASIAEAPMLRDLRAKALDTLYAARPVRQMLMRAGLGLAEPALRQTRPEVSCKFAQVSRRPAQPVSRLKHVIRGSWKFGDFLGNRRHRSRKTHSCSQSGQLGRGSCDFTFGPVRSISCSPAHTGWDETKPKDYKMKRIALLSALVAVTAGAAFAQQSPVALSSAIQSEILTVLPNADLSSLSNAQYAELTTFFLNSENTRTASDLSQGVKAILSNAQ